MLHVELLRVADAIIESIAPGTLSDDLLHQLRCVFPDNLIIAALDLVDRESVIKYMTPWGHSQYEVYGSTATYSVFVDMTMSAIPFYCTCPAFTYAVLISESHIMCKHILATRLANRMKKFIERLLTPDDLASLILRQHPDANSLATMEFTG